MDHLERAESAKHSDSAKPAERGAMYRWFWGGVTVAIGLVIGVHVSLAVLTDLVAGEGSVWSPFMLLLAALLLTVGAIWGRTHVLLLGYPTALIGALVLMSPTTAALFFGAVNWVFWIASLLVFLLSASVWLGTRRGAPVVPVQRGRVTGTAVSTQDGLHRVLAIYAVLGAAALIVPVIVLVLRGDTAHETRWRVVPHHMLVIMVWSIALYTVWITPILNLHASVINDRRAFAREARAAVRPRTWTAIWSVGLAIAAALALWMRG